MNSVHIRKAELVDSYGIAKVRDDTWRTAYRGLVPDEVLEGLSYEESNGQFFKLLQNEANVVYVAEKESGDIIGFSVGGRERNGDVRYSGEVYAIYVLQAWQRTGTGRRLMKGVVGELYAAGMKTILVWTLSESPYRRFYDSLGGVVTAQKTEVIQGAEMQLVAYGWDDTRLLFQHCNEYL